MTHDDALRKQEYKMSGQQIELIETPRVNMLI